MYTIYTLGSILACTFETKKIIVVVLATNIAVSVIV